ncbi:MAG: tetratricopeptide repeat protein [Phycisphaerales bacterium]|jgi:TolA-binding protein|nr:tetratricopeptide repeat protein [Phycisphaerales bacterium]
MLPFFAPTTVWGDSIFTGTLERPNVTIRQVNGGLVHYEIGGRAGEPIAVSKISRIQANDEPAFNAAEVAYVTGEWETAAENYQKAIADRRTNLWIVDWSLPRLVESAKRCGRFDAAVAGYIELVKKDPAAAAAYKPTLPEAKSAYLSVAVDLLSAALKEPTITNAGRQPLLLLLLEIHRLRKDDAAIAEIARQLGEIQSNADTSQQGDAGRTAAELRLGLAHVALDQGDFQKAIEQIESNRGLFTLPAQQADALYCLAMAKYGLADKVNDPAVLKEAALAFMRVVAHFKDVADLPQVADSLYRTGLIMERLNEPKSAVRIYQDVIGQYNTDPAAAKARARLEKLNAAGPS